MGMVSYTQYLGLLIAHIGWIFTSGAKGALLGDGLSYDYIIGSGELMNWA